MCIVQHDKSCEVLALKTSVDELQDEYEIALAADRALEKTFAHELRNVDPTVSDKLQKLYKKRPR